jgi:phosphonoacetate hydrolase
VYISTTDYAMHSFAPDAKEAREHMTIVDDAIGRLVENHPEATVLVTADHGMSAKKRMVDLKTALDRYGIRAKPVPIIKDRHVVHHSNLGGSIFVYLESANIGEALKVLRGTSGVEEAVSREEAAERLRLHHGRIGDILVAGEKDVVFGDPAEVSMPPSLRSHGSYHERRVPLIGYNGAFEDFAFEENRDMGRYVFERVLNVRARQQGE